MSTAADQHALLGLDIVSAVQAGIDGQDLVTLSNNLDDPLHVSLSLSDPGQGGLSESTITLASGSTQAVAVSVAYDSPTGASALAFEIDGSTTTGVNISLTRTAEVTEPPVLKQQVRDYTGNGNAAFTISYRVSRLPDFDRVELEVENVDTGHIGQETYVESTSERTVSYPPGNGTDGGAGGDTYEFRFRVYDGSGEYTDLYTEVSTVADGENPPGDDLGGENDPQLAGFTVTNDEQWTSNQFTVNYEVERLDEFEEVQIEFDNTENDWSDMTITTEDAPMGTAVYPAEGDHQGGVNGDTYEITVGVYNENGIPVDSGTVAIDAGSNQTVEWP